MHRSITHLFAAEAPRVDEDASDAAYESLTQGERMDLFIRRLPAHQSRELIDAAAVEFVKYMNTTRNRNRLVTALFEVHIVQLYV